MAQPLSAKDYLENELKNKEEACRQSHIPCNDKDIRVQQQNWTQDDWFDLLERYADYICDFEKQSNK